MEMTRRDLMIGVLASAGLSGCAGSSGGPILQPKSNSIVPFVEGRVTQGSVVRKTSRPASFTAFSTGEAGQPWNLVRAADGNLWFLVLRNGLGRITLDGSVRYFPRSTGKGILSISAQPDGYVWYCDSEANLVGRISNSGQFMQPEIELRRQSSPSHLTTSASGEIWVGSVKNGRIWAIAPIGTVRLVEELTGSYGFATASDGTVWAVKSGRLFGIDPSGTIVASTRLPEGIPTRPIVSTTGSVWFSNPERRSVYRVLEDGDVVAFDVGLAIREISAGSDGSIWGSAESALFKLSPSGELVVLSLPDPQFQPFGVAFGGDGALWASHPSEKRIARLTVLA